MITQHFWSLKQFIYWLIFTGLLLQDFCATPTRIIIVLFVLKPCSIYSIYIYFKHFCCKDDDDDIIIIIVIIIISINIIIIINITSIIWDM